MKIQALLPLLLTSAVCFAQSPVNTFYGSLVDVSCFKSAMQNRTNKMSFSNTNFGHTIRFCRAKPQTEQFGVVDSHNHLFMLDPAGNEQAESIAQEAGDKSPVRVVVHGRRHKDTISVASMNIISNSK